VLQVGFGDRLQAPGTTGVVDEHVNPAQAARQRRDGLVVCDISHDRGAADLVRQSVDPVGSARHRDHVKTLCGKRYGGRLANPGAGTGDHRDPCVS
jgi:hypothetical protein